jgi:hypothetical protein
MRHAQSVDQFLDRLQLRGTQIEFLSGRLYYDVKVLHNLISKFMDQRQMELMNRSATKIQALFRGHRCRVRRWEQRKLELHKRELVVRLQRVSRGFIVRRSIVRHIMPLYKLQRILQRQHHLAAALLTRVSRGMLGRQQARRQRLLDSATRLGAICRGFVTRAAVQRLREKRIGEWRRREQLIAASLNNVQHKANVLDQRHQAIRRRMENLDQIYSEESFSNIKQHLRPEEQKKILLPYILRNAPQPLSAMRTSYGASSGRRPFGEGYRFPKN